MEESDEEKLEVFQSWIDGSDDIVFFGGAGVSTESGIPDFRSEDGLYSQKYAYPPEMIISHSFFEENPEEFYKFYKEKMLVLDAKPNRAHLFLAELERRGKLRALITQNIDGLHQKAGSERVIELHGSIYRNYCEDCHASYSAEYVKDSPDIVPRCEKCGGIIKPDVVLYEEPLSNDAISRAIDAIYKADVLIVAGTSLTVYPASGLIDYYQRDKLVLINKSANSLDGRADLVFHRPVGELLSEVKL